METIRIYSKKAFSLGPGAIPGSDVIENFITVPFTFQDMPAMYSTDPTFKMAVKWKEIEVIEHTPTVAYESAETVNAVPTSNTFTSVVNEEKELTANEFKEKLKVMNSADTKELAEKYNAKFIDTDPLKENKKRVQIAYINYLKSLENEEDSKEETEE